MSQIKSREGNILVIGEQPPDLGILTAWLTERGYRVQSAAGRQSALEVMRESPPDLILLDVETLDGDGYEFCQQLKADRASGDMAVLLIGALGKPPDPSRVFASGAADYVCRPLQEQELLARMEVHLALKAVRRQLAEKEAEISRERAHHGQMKEQRRRSEEKYRRLVENLSDVLYSMNEQGILTYVSPAVEALLQYSAAEVIGRHIRGFFHPDDLPRLSHSFRHVLSGHSTSNEYRLLTKSGEVRWVRTSSQPIVSAERVIGIQGVLADITDHKLAEARIQQQHEFLTNVLESLTHPFYVINAADYTIESANSVARMAGLSGQATCYALTHGTSRPCETDSHPCPVEEIKRTKQPVTVEHIHYDADGNERHVEVRGYPLLDGEGHVVRVIEYALDITDRRHAEEARQQTERQYRQLLDALQEGIWVIDQEARTTFVNPRMAEMLGYTVEEMQGKHLFDFMDERDIEITRRNLERRAQGIKEQHDFEFLRKDGTRLYALLETSPITGEGGNYVGSIAGIQDITARRRVEEALQKSETLLKETQKMARLGGWELDLVTGRVVWTEEVFRIHEVPLDFEPSLENALSFYAPQDRTVLAAAIQRATESGQSWDLKLQFRTALGRELWVRAIGEAEFQGGQVVKLSGTFQDITERRQVEQTLREAKEAAEKARQEERERRQEAERGRRIAEGLVGVVAALNSSQSLDQVLTFIAEQAKRLLDNQAVAIYRLHDPSGTLTLQASQGLPMDSAAGPDFFPGLQAMRQAIASRQPVAVPGFSAVSEGSHLSPTANGAARVSPETELYPALLAVPIVAKGQVYGGAVLCYADPRAFSPDDVELAVALSDQIALAVENARLRQQAEQAAVAAERTRLARDLHDSVTQALFSASLVAEVLPQVWRRNPDEAQQGLEELRLLTHGALAEMRTMLLELRPTALMETGLQELLWQLTEAVTSRAHLVVTRDIEPVPALPPDAHVMFYRVAQEALNNVVRHAKASQATISLRAAPSILPSRGGQAQVILRLSDDGHGFDPRHTAPGHLGLRLMRERAEAVGALLTINSRAGEGTQITLVWPSGETYPAGAGR